MEFLDLLNNSPLILSECAIAERLRRAPAISMHPQLFNTPLVRDSAGRQELTRIYLEYRNIALTATLPVMLCAPTWRIDKMRLHDAGYDAALLNDAIAFMLELRESSKSPDSPVIVGALIAPKNDCYSPEQSLDRRQSAQFHRWQLEKMCEHPVDVIIAQTFPAVEEAYGIAAMMSELKKPYIISFVINRDGLILDGTPLMEAIDKIDGSVPFPPAGYMVNCVYPTFIHASEQPAALFSRLIGIQANASSKDHSQLDGSSATQQDPLPNWGKHMIALNRRHGMKILGGCCGTDGSYLRFIAHHYRDDSADIAE